MSNFSNKNYSNEPVCVGDVLVSDLFGEEEHLQHEGTKGMKWGNRRYQYPDGTLTPEGKLRYYGTKAYKGRAIREAISKLKTEFENSKEFKKMSDDDKKKKYSEIEKEARDRVEDTIASEETELKKWDDYHKYAISRVDAGKQAFYGGKTVLNEIAGLVPNVPGKYEHPDYSELTSDELIKRTNRLNVENAYAKAAGETIYVPSKQELTRERLQTIGAVVGIVGSALGGIVLPIVKHRHGSGGGDGGKKN